jgi:hypothetical protein
MTTRSTNLTALGAVALTLIIAAPVHGTSTDRHTSHLTIGGAVRLPGVTLSPGTYVFERVFAGAPDVVIVRGIDGRKVYFMATTQPSMRPHTLPADQVVTFGEAGRNTPPPITAWYPRGAEPGYAFVY